jgi:DNA mismatch endonuclease (patch repair protein)
MSAQARENTKPELAVRRALFARGLRFRLHPRIGRCRPDVVLSKAKIAIFVMGDFWHGCPTRHCAEVEQHVVGGEARHEPCPG